MRATLTVDPRHRTHRRSILFCGRDADVNPLAADTDLRIELLEAGPFCVDESGAVAACSANASRTQRSGVYDLAYMAREDRRYCEEDFARQRLTPETASEVAAIELCRANLTERLEHCAIECDTCKAECTSAAARAAASAYRCSVGLPTVGLTAAFHASDIGQDISYRYGAIRKEQRPPAPDLAWQEQFHTLVNNRIDSPVGPRRAISCRKSHRESSTGGYTPPLKPNGEPLERAGFMVGCDTDLDCYNRCGEHPIHGHAYVCTLNMSFYTHAGYNADVAAKLQADAAALAAAGEAHQKVARSSRDSAFYMIDEPGDDKYDVADGSAGVCTDVHVSYGNTGCESAGGAKATLSVIGCTGRATGWSQDFCGALVETTDSDFVTGVSIAESSLEYPRTLVPEAQVNGKVELPVTCSDVEDCVKKCEFFSFNARDGGLPSPEACALCDPPCPDNLATTAIDLAVAVRHDVESALRLAAVCQESVAACACQTLMMLRPAWLQNLESPVEKCSSASDVISLIMDRIIVDNIRQAESLVNGLIDGVNKIIGWIKKIDHVCWEYKTFKRCPEDPESLAAIFGCNPGATEPHRRCYYERQKAVCLGKAETYEDYKNLFHSPTASELEQQFADIVGDSYESLPPSLMQAFQNVDTTDTGYNQAAQNICDSSLLDSMTLDQLVRSAGFRL